MDSKVIMEEDESKIWRKLCHQMISLQNVTIKNVSNKGQYALSVVGKVRVVNWCYVKKVFARITFDKWKSYRDYKGQYLSSSHDGSSDVFCVGFVLRDTSPVDVEFALSCIQGGIQGWDNNYSKNYQFHLDENPYPEESSMESATLKKEDNSIIESTIISQVDSTLEACQDRDSINAQIVEHEEPKDKSDKLIIDTTQAKTTDATEYSQFKPHPLTPTTIHFNTCPKEEEITAQETSVENAVFEEPDSSQETNQKEPQLNSDNYLATDGIEVTVSEEQPGESEPAADGKHENQVSEETIEPVNHDRSKDFEAHNEMHDKLVTDQVRDECQAAQMSEPTLTEIHYEQQSEDGKANDTSGEIDIELQVFEEPGDASEKQEAQKLPDEAQENADGQQKNGDGKIQPQKDLELISNPSDSDGESPKRGGCGRFVSYLPCTGKKEKKKKRAK